VSSCVTRRPRTFGLSTGQFRSTYKTYYWNADITSPHTLITSTACSASFFTLNASSLSHSTMTRSSTACSVSTTPWVECPRFRGHLSAGSVLSDLAGRMRHHAKGIESTEAVPAGVSA
jgi:hypothetical protein